MKRKVMILILVIFSVLHVYSQNQPQNVKETKTTISKSCETPDRDWSWNNNQWFYKGKAIYTSPPNYKEIEEKSVTVIYKNGKTVTTCSKTILEVKTVYETSLRDWTWNNGQWFYKGKVVDSTPPSYTVTKQENKTVYNLCE
jgi:hypothetical protein